MEINEKGNKNAEDISIGIEFSKLGTVKTSLSAGSPEALTR